MVADCSRAGIEYTQLNGHVRRQSTVADCSRAGIDYTAERSVACQVCGLRIARGLGSNTLRITGLPSPMVSCGLLAGWDRVHWLMPLPARGPVADCSRAGIGYTSAACVARSPRVADCSRAGIDYTAGGVLPPWSRCGLLAGWDRVHSADGTAIQRSLVADCSRAGIEYTRPVSRRDCLLRIARGLGSITLVRPCRCIAAACCGLLAGWDRVHCTLLGIRCT